MKTLSDLLNNGLPVFGSALDLKLKPLSVMNEAAAKRHRYLDTNGFWTDRGYNRATSTDYAKLDAATKAFQVKR